MPATLLGMRGVSKKLSHAADEPDSRREVVPAYAMPEDAVRALAAATRYAEWLSRDRGVPVMPSGIDRAAAEAIVTTVLAPTPTAGS